ncbi:hypothetical protein IAU59_002411 [Kwoniella sp. CBS 9459]
MDKGKASSPAIKGALPLKEYFALHAYLSTLLILSFVFLPHSTPYVLLKLGADSHDKSHARVHVQSSSADRPEHPFLTPITSQPAVTMLWDVLGMTVCMAWWGARMLRWSASSDGRIGGKGQAERNLVGENEVSERQARTGKMLQRVGEAAAATLAIAVVLFVILETLGAPLDSHLLRTALLALHLSLLTVWPVVHTFGVPSIYDKGLAARYRMTRLFCEFRPESPLERALVYPAVGALLGAWLGVVPIALDWDRPWQSYPLTPAFGSILGFIVAGFASFLRSAYEDTLNQVELEKNQIADSTATKNKKRKKIKA